MKKILMWASIWLIGTAACLQAQNAIIMESGGKKRDVNQITVDETTPGTIRFTEGPTNVGSMMRAGQYLWAWIPKPKEIADADALMEAGEYAKAAAAFAAVRPKFGILGWEVYTIRREAEAFIRQDKKSEGVTLLEALENHRIANPALETDLMTAFALLVDAYMDLGTPEKAAPFLDRMVNAKDDESASLGFIKKGDIAIASGADKMDAVLYYFQAALLFPTSKHRPEALFKVATTMRELKDARSEKFVEIMKREYLDNSFTKQLK